MKDDTRDILIGIGVLVALTGVVYFYTSGQLPSDLSPEPTESSDYEVSVDIEPNEICYGDQFYGEIESNIDNGVCRIFLNPMGEGWTKLKDVDLNEDGYYRELSDPVRRLGYADIAVACSESVDKAMEGEYGVSEAERLNVINCTDGSDSSDDGTSGPYEGMACSSVPPGQETCVQGACDQGTCTYVSGTLFQSARCECR